MLATLEQQMPEPPAEVRYCGGERPWWLARWAVFERYEGWRKYAVRPLHG